MKAEMMNPSLATEPSPPDHHLVKQMPISGLMIGHDIGAAMYTYNNEDYNHGLVYSPTQSYSSSNSTDTDHRQLSFDQSMYQLQSPTVSELSALQLSPPPPPASPPLPPRVYKPCVVCSDKSSGYHYTVSSCEGCKGFFRRSIQKNMQYTCHKDQQCEINKVTRNRCQFCRLNKCLEMGMSKEAVRNDRKKKRVKSQDTTTSTNCSTSQQIEELTEKDQQLIGIILSAHRNTFPDHDYDDSNPGELFVRMEFNKMMDLHSRSSNSSSPESVDDQMTDMILWERVSELSEQGVRRIVSFAQSIPGFITLSKSDQEALLKAAILEVMILRLCLRFDHHNDSMSFACGLSLNRSQMRMLGFGSLTDDIFKLAASLSQLNADNTVFAMIAAICLMSGDQCGLQNTTEIEAIQEPLCIALGHYLAIHFPSQPRLLAKLLGKVTDLRQISIQGGEVVLNLSASRQANISPLLEELLRRTENVDLSNPIRMSVDLKIPPEMIDSSKP